MTAIQRPRDILGALPLALFYPDPNTLPSPISFPVRAGPSITPTYTSTPTSSEKRKRTIQPDVDDVPDTVKRLRSRSIKAFKAVTPKERAFMDRDELGTGRSPARRLFVNELDGASCVDKHIYLYTANPSRGISGAVAFAPPSPAGASAQAPLIQPSSKASSSQRTPSLAPSPPISASTTPRSTPRRKAKASLADEGEVDCTPTSKRASGSDHVSDELVENVHEIGFSIYADAPAASRANSAARAHRHDDTDTGPDDEEGDKENVRPTPTASLSLPYLASPGPSRPRSRLRESAINLDLDSPASSTKGTPVKAARASVEDGAEEEEEEELLIRQKAARAGYRASPRRAAVGRI